MASDDTMYVLLVLNAEKHDQVFVCRMNDDTGEYGVSSILGDHLLVFNTMTEACDAKSSISVTYNGSKRSLFPVSVKRELLYPPRPKPIIISNGVQQPDADIKDVVEAMAKRHKQWKKRVRRVRHYNDKFMRRNQDVPKCVSITDFLSAGHRVDRHTIFVREYILVSVCQQVHAIVSLASSKEFGALSDQTPTSSTLAQVFFSYKEQTSRDYIYPFTKNEPSRLTLCHPIEKKSPPVAWSSVIFYDISNNQWLQVPWYDLRQPLCINSRVVLVPCEWSAFDTSKAVNLLCHCGSMNETFFCGGCKLKRYCGKPCQRSDWSSHRSFCRAHREQVPSRENDIHVISDDMCAQCGQPSSHYCSGCGVTRYCTQDCQQRHRANHKAFCQALSMYRDMCKRPYYVPFPVKEEEKEE